MTQPKHPLADSEALKIFDRLLRPNSKVQHITDKKTAERAVKTTTSYLNLRKSANYYWAPDPKSIELIYTTDSEPYVIKQYEDGKRSFSPGFGAFGRLYLDLAIDANECPAQAPEGQCDRYKSLETKGDYPDLEISESVRLIVMPFMCAEVWLFAKNLDKASGGSKARLTWQQLVTALQDFESPKELPKESHADMQSFGLCFEAEVNTYLARFDDVGQEKVGSALPLKLTLFRVAAPETESLKTTPLTLTLCPSLITSLDFFSEEKEAIEGSSGWWSSLDLAANSAIFIYNECVKKEKQDACRLTGHYVARWHLEQSLTERGCDDKEEGKGYQGLLLGTSHGGAFAAGLLQALAMAHQNKKHSAAHAKTA